MDIIAKIDSGENLLFHGPGGTGKTYIMKEIIKHYKSKKIVIVAPTGKAAVAMDIENATTIHRLFQIPNIPGNIREFQLDEILRQERFKIEADLIIIDEISMVGAKILEIIDMLLQKMYNCDLVMGGIQVILSGDFYQLRPVKDDWCFKTNTWTNLKLQLVEFDTSRRYENDLTFELLNRLRRNQISDDDKILLESRRQAFFDKEYRRHIVWPTMLCGTNDETNQMNKKKLRLLEGDQYTNNAVDKFSDIYDQYTGNEKNEILRELAPSVIAFKVGAVILITKNIGKELANGMLGIVTDIKIDKVHVKLDNGKTSIIGLCRYMIETHDYIAIRMQYPFKLGWAITVHKSQGTTLDSAVIKLDNIDHPGQLYVALSRVRDINCVYIKGNIHYSRIRCNMQLPPEIL